MPHATQRAENREETKMIRDLQFALRMLRKQPGFTLVAVLTLALGIGATASVFSLIQGVLWTAPPYQDPQELVLIQPARAAGDTGDLARGWPAEQWLEWQQEAQSLDSIAAYSWIFSFIVQPGATDSIQGMAVTREYFDTLGLQPQLGRTFAPEETLPNAPPTVILGYDLWQSTFGGDPNILGQTIPLSRYETMPTVVGVMPPGIRFLPSPNDAQEPNYDVNARVDYWIPAAPNPERLRVPRWDLVARTAPGADLEQAQAELSLLAERQGQTDPDFAGVAPKLRALETVANRDGEAILFPLFGAAALVLLIACGNAAALLLVRGMQRGQEYAVRGALGSGRVGLLRQAAVESLVLAAVSGALGVLVALGVVRAVQAVAGNAIPRLDAVEVGWPVLVCALAAAALSALLAGVAPAFRAARMDPVGALKDAGPKSSAGRNERRLLRGVTIAQTALTLVLLVGAGLLIRTMINLAQVDAGYRADRVLTMSVTSVEGDWADFHRQALDRTQQIPGVQRAAFAWGVPLTGNSWPGVARIEGQPEPRDASERITLPLRAVTPGYFDVLDVPVLEGRDVRESDNQQAERQVALANQAFVDRYFPDVSPLGKKVWLRGPDNPPVEIIGVAANGRNEDLTAAATPELYLSLWQFRAFSKHLLVRTASEPAAVAASIQGALRAVNPTVAIEHVQTLGQIRADSQASRAFATQLLIAFAVVAGVLTLVGIYGVMSLAVASRRRELAIRSAVGAQKRDIRTLVFGEGFRLVAWGVGAGLVGALALSNVLETFLFGVDPNDPLTVVAVALLFALIATAACWSPMRRAVRTNPVEALRSE